MFERSVGFIPVDVHEPRTGLDWAWAVSTAGGAMTDDPPRTAPRITTTFFASGRSVLTADGVSERHPSPVGVLERVVALARRQSSGQVVVRVLTVDGTRIRVVAAADGTFRDEACPAQAYGADELAALVLALAALDDDEPDASPVRRRDPRGSVLVPDPLLSLPPWCPPRERWASGQPVRRCTS